MGLNLNQTFFSEYTAFDNFLREERKTESGVSAYIDELSLDSSFSDPSRETAKKTLKRLRFLRNRLAHDSGAFSQELVTDEDLKLLRAFDVSVQRHTDPLSVKPEPAPEPEPAPVKATVKRTRKTTTPSGEPASSDLRVLPIYKNRASRPFVTDEDLYEEEAAEVEPKRAPNTKKEGRLYLVLLLILLTAIAAALIYALVKSLI